MKRTAPLRRRLSSTAGGVLTEIALGLWLMLVAAISTASAQPASRPVSSPPPEASLPGLYPEGPVVIDGDLYVAEMTGSRVTRLSPEAGADRGYRREIFFFRKGCGPTALATIAKNRIAILCHLEGAVAIVDRNGALLTLITHSADGVRLDSPNDISSDGAGGAFFSNAGIFHPKAKPRGRVMRLAPDLTVTTAASGLFYANGVAVDRKAGRVLVSEHLARRVLSFRLSEDLTRLSRPQTLIDFKEFGALIRHDHPLTGPDGVEIGPDGSVLVAVYGDEAFVRRAPNGVLTRHKAGTRYLCSLAFWRGRLAMVGAHRNDAPPYHGLIEIIDLPF